MAASNFLGLRTVIYAAPSLEKTKEWYTKALGIEPYFDEPFYVGFNVGGYELGLDPNAQPAEGSTLKQIEPEVQRLLDLGATVKDAVEEVGDEIKVAAIRDPFGNVVGLIENPHFKR
ncbi:VOC family protein [Spirosoma sp. KNUC1025]|uniref:VOC family protein n=1 Tax=Spirosoma sp. KNUC1025 TaxID=2894082 RepID=UPI00386888C5|nr:VOC family protein [Spirosoma sp. KNUC1025]